MVVARLGLGELHQQAHHFGGRVELAALLAGAVGKELDQVFVGRAEQVGELEIVVDQHELGLVEVVQQVLPLLVRDLGLPFDGVEIDVVLQHPGQGVVFLFNGGDGLVEHVADVVLQVLERRDLRRRSRRSRSRASGRARGQRRSRRRRSCPPAVP